MSYPAISLGISPYEEMVAYETLWGMQKSLSFKRLAELFQNEDILPSQMLQREGDLFISELKDKVENYLSTKNGFSVCIRGDFQYSQKLLAAKYPLELFYYKGNLELLENKCVSVVGARKCTRDGELRAKKLTRLLVDHGYTIVSGLAKGIDTAAHTSAIKHGGITIGVIGTPIDKFFPKENKELQNQISQQFLLISQVPFYRYEHWPSEQRGYFPERNVTMAALSQATIIVEASNTSGSLIQARACLAQGRKLFILNSCFENKAITWPDYYEKRGAIRVRDIEDILSQLG